VFRYDRSCDDLESGPDDLISSYLDMLVDLVGLQFDLRLGK